MVIELVDNYGKNKLGEENARFRIPWGAPDKEQFEKSYYIQGTVSGKFDVTDEGFFPYNG